MEFNLTKYAEVTNRLGQLMEFYENPIRGDEAPVIIVYHAEKIAVESDFFEPDDMLQGEDYEPLYKNGEILLAFESKN